MGWSTSECGLSSIPVLQVRHKSVVLYYEPLKRGKLHYTEYEKQQRQDLYKQAYSGRVTDGVRKRLTKAINVMLQVIKPAYVKNPVTGYLQYHKLSFITLKSVVTDITAREGYDNLLCYFLDWLTRTIGVKLYVWKAEYCKSGELHYHITTPDFIDYREIKKKWNGLLRQAGYLENYVQQHGNYHANSTDIHGVNDVENLASYLKKAILEGIEAAEKIKKTRTAKTRSEKSVTAEMAKDCQNEVEENEGKIWGCCELLSFAQYVSITCGNRHTDAIDKLVSNKSVTRFSDEKGWWHVFTFTGCSPPEILSALENNYIRDHLQWQLARPSKSAELEDFAKWVNSKPLLNYN